MNQINFLFCPNQKKNSTNEPAEQASVIFEIFFHLFLCNFFYTVCQNHKIVQMLLNVIKIFATFAVAAPMAHWKFESLNN